jgi:hypothetical protein
MDARNYSLLQFAIQRHGGLWNESVLLRDKHSSSSSPKSAVRIELGEVRIFQQQSWRS